VSPVGGFVASAGKARFSTKVSSSRSFWFHTRTAIDIENIPDEATGCCTAINIPLEEHVLSERHRPRSIARAADFIRDNYKQLLKPKDICSAAGLSVSYLIRAFKDEYGMTPHAYLVNCRIEFARSQLRKGRSIAAVALESGFADQAHLQRAFKRFVAATPGQYRFQ
jgi:AraC-like DNA-binding protein